MADSTDLRRPDFHIITKGGARFFVEVKNFSPDDAHAPFELKASYLLKLQNYAERFGRDLKIAVYWRHAEGMWTLVGAEYFDRDGDKRVLSFEAALKRNEMSTLGDSMIGTVPPLAIRVYTDPERPRRIGPDGSAPCTIKRVTLCAAGEEIDDPLEQKLAWFFMTRGNWIDAGTPAGVKDGDLLSFEMQLAPRANDNPEQEFASIGWLSQMISNQYRDLTAADGKVSLLSPSKEPGALGVLIPTDYEGKVLSLWRFRLRPHYDGLVGAERS